MLFNFRQIFCFLLVLVCSLGLSGAESTGTGLAAQYFPNETLSGTPAVSRIDAQVNFNWAGGAAAVSLPVDSFSARWDGEIEALYSEPLTLIARTDDGVRIWINGSLVIDAWVLRGAADSTYTFTAEAGQKYRVRMEYYEHFGSAVAQLEWQSGTLIRAAIPTAQLYPTIPPQSAVGTGTGLLARYYANETLSGAAVVSRTDTIVDFNWGGTSPDAAVPVDGFSARWDGEIEARFSEPLTITARTDDGVRVWLDGILMIDAWILRGAANSTFTFSAEAGHRYRIRMEYFDHTGSAVAKLWWQSASEFQGPIPSSQLYPTPANDPPIGTGTGLLARFYSNETLSGAPVLTRTDARVDFDWAGGSPGAGVPSDVFSARWDGEIEPRTTEALTLILRTDDGVRLWLDDQLVINAWILRGAAESTFTFNAQAGHRYRIRIDYFEHLGSAVAKFWWQSPSEPKSPVPTSQLYPTAPVEHPLGTGTGLAGSYFANETLTGTPALVRLDPVIDFDWAGGSPAAAIPADSFSVRWEGEFEPRYTEALTITARTDDGVRVWIDDVAVIAAWGPRSATDSTYSFNAQAGQRYRIRMEYFDRTGSAVAKLWWQSAHELRGPIPMAQLYPASMPATSSLAFTTGSAAVSEKGGSTTIAVMLTPASTTAVTASISSVGSGIQIPTLLTIPAGEVSASIPVTILDDPRFGPDRQVTISLSNPIGAVLGQATHVLTLQNTDAQPTIGFTTSGSFNLEQSGTASVVVRLSAVSAVPTSVSVGTSGSATAGQDYTAPAATLQIPADTFDGVIFLPLLSDAEPEADETIVITLFNPINATLGSATAHTLTISDGNAPPVIVSGPTPATNPVTGSSVQLSLVASDDGGPSALTTTWSAQGAPSGAVMFIPSSSTGFTVTTVATFAEPGTYVIQAQVHDAYDAIDIKQVIVTVVAPRQPQSITFDPPPAKVYGDAPFALTATASSGLPVMLTSADPTIATISGNVVTIIGAGTTTITAAQPGDTAWEPAEPVTHQVIVAKASQIITFGPLSQRMEGDPDFFLVATATSGLPVAFVSSNSAIASITGTTISIISAGTTTITASQSGNQNFEAAVAVDRPLTVQAVNLTPVITASAPVSVTHERTRQTRYVTRTSDDLGGPSYQWIDISGADPNVAAGTLVSGLGDDSNSGPISLGFAFPFYGKTYSTINICSNGWASFTDTSVSYQNEDIPSSSAPVNLLALFWTDLNFYSSGSCYIGHSDPNHVVIQFQDVAIYGGTELLSAEIILGSDGSIVFQYLAIPNPTAIFPTIGVQADGTRGVQALYNNEGLHSSLAVAFVPQLPQETGSAGVITLSRTGVTSQPLDVSYEIAGSATNGVDYDYVVQTATIPAGQSTTAVFIHAGEDGVVETDESVLITIMPSATYEVGVQSQAQVTIKDASAGDGQPSSVTPTISLTVPMPTTRERYSQVYYTARMSTEPGGPVYNWIDISGADPNIPAGTLIPDLAWDSNVNLYPLGFDFPFYNRVFSSVRVSSTGWVSFTDTSDDFWYDSLIPGENAPNNSIALFWSYLLDFSSGGACYLSRVDADHVVIQYQGVPVTGGVGQQLSAQIILGRDGSIVLQYQALPLEGQEVTVGIQKGPTQGKQVLYSTRDMVAEMAIAFTRHEPATTVPPAVVTISRTGETGAPLKVFYNLSGTASAADYAPLPGFITIPADQSAVAIEVDAIGDYLLETTDETVVVTLVPSPNYEIGESSQGVATILADTTGSQPGLDALPSLTVTTVPSGESAEWIIAARAWASHAGPDEALLYSWRLDSYPDGLQAQVPIDGWIDGQWTPFAPVSLYSVDPSVRPTMANNQALRRMGVHIGLIPGFYAFTLRVTAPSGTFVESPASISVVPYTMSMTPTVLYQNIGTPITQQFSAVGIAPDSTPLSPALIRWSSTTGTISESGLFVGGNAGGVVLAYGEGVATYPGIARVYLQRSQRTMLVSPPPFDRAAWDSSLAYRTGYLSDNYPGRVWQTLTAGPGIPSLEIQSATPVIPVSGSALLRVRGAPNSPITFVATGQGFFEANNLNIITVIADTVGDADVVFRTNSGRGRMSILAGSPMSSGSARFIVEAP